MEDQGEKQNKSLENLKPKEQTKVIKYISGNKNNQSIAANIFNDLIEKEKA